MGFGGGVVTENISLNQFAAGFEDLRDRMRTQDWYHDLAEQQSSDEIHEMADGCPCLGLQHQDVAQLHKQEFHRDFEALLAQLRQDTEAQRMDEDTIHQKITHFLAEYQRREVNRQGTRTKT